MLTPSDRNDLVNSHEVAVRNEGGTTEIIFDVIRLGAAVTGVYVTMQERTPTD